MYLEQAIEEKLNDIKQDKISGAAVLIIKATEILTFFATHYTNPSLEQFIGDLYKLTVQLVHSQPTMAPFYNLVHRATLETQITSTLENAKQKLIEVSTKFQQEQENSGYKIALNAAKILLDRQNILTHSFSSTVSKALTHAFENGKRITVFCTESRPQREGQKMALALAKEGLEVKLIADSASFSLLERHMIDMVLCGGDSLFEQGLVNKIGTRGLALSCWYEKIPFYDLCSLTKFLSTPLKPSLGEINNPSEISLLHAPNLEVINFYFDLTPLELLVGVVTEKGILNHAEVLSELKGKEFNQKLFTAEERRLP